MKLLNVLSASVLCAALACGASASTVSGAPVSNTNRSTQPYADSWMTGKEFYLVPGQQSGNDASRNNPGSADLGSFVNGVVSLLEDLFGGRSSRRAASQSSPQSNTNGIVMTPQRLPQTDPGTGQGGSAFAPAAQNPASDPTSAPAAAAITPVPTPAAGFLLVGAIAGFSVLRRRQRA